MKVGNKMLLTKKIAIGWLIVSAIISFLLYTVFYDIHRGADMISLNDEWEHQSMAVNYAEGFGLYKLGAFTDFSKYHIDAYDATFPFLKKLCIEYPTAYYHRAVGFSMIVGTLYKLVGTHPFYLRVFNFVIIFLSWLILSWSIFKTTTNKKLLTWMLLCLPIFMVLNFNYIDLIGDDTLVVFSLSIVFYFMLRWIKHNHFFDSFMLTLSLLFSIFIKSTLLLVPIFILLGVLILKMKKYYIHAVVMNGMVFTIVILYSNAINKKHQAYRYVKSEQFHADMLSSDWSKSDSLFIQQYHLKKKAIINFDFTIYKKLATYLFERQFYTKKKFLLSGQSLFLLIDGNNETCIRFPEKHIGSWMPYWKFVETSFFYDYQESASPYLHILKFYFHKPILLPILMYIKLYAGYYWNYFFIFLAVMQCILACFIYYKPNTNRRMVGCILGSILLHILLHLFYMTKTQDI